MYHATRKTDSEAFMTEDSDRDGLSIFRPDFDSMTADELLAYIERSRRQMDRFERLPGGAENPIDPQELAEIRRMLDELEATVLSGR